MCLVISLLLTLEAVNSVAAAAVQVVAAAAAAHVAAASLRVSYILDRSLC